MDVPRVLAVVRPFFEGRNEPYTSIPSPRWDGWTCSM